MAAKNLLHQWITQCNAFFIRKTGGRLGCRLGPYSILLLRTIGRKTGRVRAAPLAYCRDGGNFLLVASNWGSETPPAWFLNLARNPRASIQIESGIFEVETRLASDEEYSRLWELVASQVPFYPRYQKNMTRSIPIVVAVPAADVQPG